MDGAARQDAQRANGRTGPGAFPKRVVGLAIKLIFSASLLVYLFANVGWGEVWAELSGANPALVALYVLIGLVATLLSAIKWSTLARAHGFRDGVPRLFLLYLVGTSLNNALPTNVGGDVFRAYELGRASGRHADAMASVFIEKLTGLVTLVGLVVLGLAFDPRLLGDRRLLIVIGAALGILLSVIVAVCSGPMVDGAIARIRVAPVAAALRKVRSFQGAVRRYEGHRTVLIAAILYSIGFYGTAVLAVHVGLHALGTRVPLLDLAAAVPVMLLIFTIPISFGGIGLQEWGFVYVLSTVGVPAPAGLAMGVLFRTRAILVGLAGAALYPWATRRGGRPASPAGGARRGAPPLPDAPESAPAASPGRPGP